MTKILKDIRESLIALWVNLLWWLGFINLDNILFHYKGKTIIVSVSEGFNGYIIPHKTDDGEYDYRLTVMGIYNVKIATDIKYTGNDYFGKYKAICFIGIKE